MSPRRTADVASRLQTCARHESECILPGMKAAISMPDDVFMAGEAMVEARGWTRSKLYTEALRQYLRHQDPSDLTARLNQVHPVADDTKAVRRKANRAALKASDW